MLFKNSGKEVLTWNAPGHSIVVGANRATHCHQCEPATETAGTGVASAGDWSRLPPSRPLRRQKRVTLIDDRPKG